MKFYFIAGEKSGDLHAANLVKALKSQFKNAQFRGFGGDLMEAEGVVLSKHYRETAFMGFWEVLKNIGTIRKLLSFAKKDIISYQPDVVVFVDYPGFNLRIAKYLRKYYEKKFSHKPKLFYYISPKLWAWNQGRARQIKQNIDFMFSILPFELSFYKKFDFQSVAYVGNPLFDAIEGFRPDESFTKTNQLDKPEKKTIALLAGSRKQEVASLLPVMIATTKLFDPRKYQFVLAGVSHLEESLYEEAKENDITVIFEQTYDLLSHADAAIVASGTATLETALFEVPQVVVYKVSPITYQIAKRVIKVEWVSLVNLIANKELVRELLQNDCTPPKIAEELKAVLTEKNEEMRADYRELKKQIQTEGVSARTAKLIKELTQKEH